MGTDAVVISRPEGGGAVYACNPCVRRDGIVPPPRQDSGGTA
ncbi:hypothetical protein [Streptomyces sp. NPDC021020]